MTDFEIEALLQKAMGLKVTSIGKATLERSVQRRMNALSIKDRSAYVDRLKSSTFEIKELIEEVVIPETWFFRDGEPFKALSQFLVTQWAPKQKGSLLRVLSIPCSTGEEPYSLTMSLLMSGWQADKFTVHAVDISKRSIARAKEGVYSEHSFRGNNIAYRSRYFKKSGKQYILNKKIQDKVIFHNGNVLDSSFLKELGTFNVIFFRNVLIYFDEHSRHRAISNLANIMADDGIIFVGHAEANLFINFPFTPAPYKQAFAFYKKPEQQIKAEATTEPDNAKPTPAKHKSYVRKRVFPFQKKENNTQPDLTLARELADKGKLEKASEICEKYLNQHGASAQAFFLLGIIHEAADDAIQSEKFFRKALYLEPNHEETLVFLALLAERSGDISEAAALKQRLERLQRGTPPQHHNS